METEMVFDWVMAAIRIGRDQPRMASLRLKGEPIEFLIYRDGKPVIDPLRQRIASHCRIPQLVLDGGPPIDCWVDADLIPHSQTQWWPADAKAILEGAK